MEKLLKDFMKKLDEIIDEIKRVLNMKFSFDIFIGWKDFYNELIKMELFLVLEFVKCIE